MNDGIYYPSRREQTNAILRKIQDSEDDKQRQKWAWEVVLLNDAASTWLAKGSQGRRSFSSGSSFPCA